MLCPWCPPQSTAQAATCRFVKESGAAGSLEMDAMAQHALRTPSPLLLRRERAVMGRGRGQRTLGDRHCLQQLLESVCSEIPAREVRPEYRAHFRPEFRAEKRGCGGRTSAIATHGRVLAIALVIRSLT